MSIFEEKGCITYKNKDGDLYRLYPETKKECVSGMEDIDAHLVDAENPHNVSAVQIGAIAIEDIASLEEVLEYLGITKDDTGSEDGDDSVLAMVRMMQGDSFPVYFTISLNGVDLITPDAADDIEVCIDAGNNLLIRKTLSEGSVSYDTEKLKWSFRLTQQETLSMTPNAIYDVDARVKYGEDVHGISIGRIVIQDSISEEVI